MRISLVVFLMFCCLACTQKISQRVDQEDKSFKLNKLISKLSIRYDSFLGEGEQKMETDYCTIISKKVDGKYIKRVFFHDTKTMTHYNEYMDRTLSVKHGPEKVWNDQGLLTRDGHFIDGKEEGLFKNYELQTGELISEGNYREGQREGDWKFYRANGKLKRQSQYKNGLKQGNEENYDKEGVLYSKIDYRADTIYHSQIMSAVENPSVYKMTEQMPMYGTGCPELKEMEARQKCAQRNMLETIYRNLKYPVLARENGIEGTVYVRFIVDKVGSIKNIYVTRGINQDFTDEVTRVMEFLETWVPGSQDGKPVDVMFTLPIKFSL